MAYQITSLTIVYSTVYSCAYQTKHQSPASLAFVQGIHRWLVNSPHKRPVTRKMSPFDDVIMFERIHFHNFTILHDWFVYPNKSFLQTFFTWLFFVYYFLIRHSLMFCSPIIFGFFVCFFSTVIAVPGTMACLVVISLIMPFAGKFRRLNINTPSYWCRNFNYKYKDSLTTILSLSGKSYTWKDGLYIETRPSQLPYKLNESMFGFRMSHTRHAIMYGSIHWTVPDGHW